MTQGVPEETCGDFGGRRNDGRECGRPSGWGTDFDSGKCRECRGTKPDGTVPDDHGAPEANNNAVRHSLHANRDSLYEYFPDEYQREVDKIEAALLNRYEEYHGRKPDDADAKDCYELAMGYVQRQYARDYMVEQADESGNPLLSHVEMEKNGEEIEFDKPNDVLSVVNDIRREDRLTRQTKGLEKDPESQKAEAGQELGDIVREMAFDE